MIPKIPIVSAIFFSSCFQDGFNDAAGGGKSQDKGARDDS